MDPLPGSFKQGNAKLLLELHDLPAERRLRNMQDLGGTAGIARFGDRDEIAELARGEHFSSIFKSLEVSTLAYSVLDSLASHGDSWHTPTQGDRHAVLCPSHQKYRKVQRCR